jgi:hypothetical protein
LVAFYALHLSQHIINILLLFLVEFPGEPGFDFSDLIEGWVDPRADLDDTEK